VIASGGVTTAEQIARLAGMRLEGAIVGSALYAGKITLPEAIRAAHST
jgi:phosphoribosylformimino-5-aminoimidazole carboxamide ribonucleotide (ProFAR) isomerase